MSWKIASGVVVHRYLAQARGHPWYESVTLCGAEIRCFGDMGQAGGNITMNWKKVSCKRCLKLKSTVRQRKRRIR